MSADGAATAAGQPDCHDVLAKLAFFLDHELADADACEIRQHIEECRPCMDRLVLERTVTALVARSCCESAPEALRRQVLVRIREVRLHIEQ